MTRIEDAAANNRERLAGLACVLAALGLAAPAAAQDFSGTYVQHVEVGTVTKVPIFGRTNTITRSVVLLTIAPGEAAGAWVQSQKACHVEIEDDSSAGDPVLEQSFIDNVPPATYPVRFTDNGDGTWGYFADTGVVAVGYDATTDETLPTKKKDPRIADTDQDGYPGASLGLKVPLFGDIKIFSTQRTQSVFTGTWADGGIDTGPVALPVMESHAFGATIGLFAVNPKVEQVTSKHWHSIERVADGASCADVL